MAKEEKKEYPKTKISDEKVWLGLSDSGKGVTLRVGDAFYIGSKETLSGLVNGEKKGCPLSKVVPA